MTQNDHILSGLAGSLPRSSSVDIKREEKEDDENSLNDKSDDDKKDGKMSRTRTRYRSAYTRSQTCYSLVSLLV